MKPKARKNLAKDVEAEPAKSYILPDQLRQMIAQALLSSSPHQLSVSDINQIVKELGALKEV